MKYILILFGIWFFYVIANICIADANANTSLVRRQQKINTPINHFVWGLYYGAACAPMYWIFKDWYYLGSIVLLHGALIGPFFNVFTKAPSTWYLASDSVAITDKIMRGLGMKSTELFNFACLFASVVLLVISFFQNH